MRILAIETSCDETSCAVLEKENDSIKVLSNITATSLSLHAKTGGIIPENAAREQIKMIIPVMEEALLESEKSASLEFRNCELPETPKTGNSEYSENKWNKANQILSQEIDAIAVTQGPGLIGSLLIGVETAKTLSFVFNKPIVPVNHLLAHIFANFIQPKSDERQAINFPFIGLIVSGGHTDLLLFENIKKYKWLGGTRDDAAGEALDKIGRLLNLSYPAGPEIEQRASKIKKTNIAFKSPLLDSEDFDFSFSGLKAEVARFINARGDAKRGTPIERAQGAKRASTSDGGAKRQDPEQHAQEFFINQVCYATQKAIIDVLVKKTVRAAKMFEVNQILLGGGVSANQTLTENLKLEIGNLKLGIDLLSPEKTYCTDNAAMIGAQALMDFKPINWKEINAMPNLYFK